MQESDNCIQSPFCCPCHVDVEGCRTVTVTLTMQSNVDDLSWSIRERTRVGLNAVPKLSLCWDAHVPSDTMLDHAICTTTVRLAPGCYILGLQVENALDIYNYASLEVSLAGEPEPQVQVATVGFGVEVDGAFFVPNVCPAPNVDIPGCADVQMQIRYPTLSVKDFRNRRMTSCDTPRDLPQRPVADHRERRRRADGRGAGPVPPVPECGDLRPPHDRPVRRRLA